MGIAPTNHGTFLRPGRRLRDVQAQQEAQNPQLAAAGVCCNTQLPDSMDAPALVVHYSLSVCSSVITHLNPGGINPSQETDTCFSLVLKKRTQYNIFMSGKKGSELQSLG